MALLSTSYLVFDKERIDVNGMSMIYAIDARLFSIKELSCDKCIAVSVY